MGRGTVWWGFHEAISHCGSLVMQLFQGHLHSSKSSFMHVPERNCSKLISSSQAWVESLG